MSGMDRALLRLGPKYIPDNPQLANVRMGQELEKVERKIRHVFTQHGWALPQTRLQKFKDNLVNILTECQEKYPPGSQLRRISQLRKRLETSSTVIRKTDKSKVFHLGTTDDYRRKTQAYMEKTKAYRDLGTINPLEPLVDKTNIFLHDLWQRKKISQKQYEKLKVNKDEAELAHLYFLPKAHKVGTPLRPIIAGLHSPTIAISRWLDLLLRPLFDKLAGETTIPNGTELVKQVEKWASQHLTVDTRFITMDVTDLYTMIPQEGGVQALRKMMEKFGLEQIEGVDKAIILDLARFVMTNNFFYLDGKYYQQTRGGAMGSPLTLTIANTYMYFVERPIAKWAKRTMALYFRYIDDLFIASNAPLQTLKDLVRFWNRLDVNIELSETIGFAAEYLDVHLENKGDRVETRVFHKPSYEPYFLPFTSTHAAHVKKNIPYGALVRAIRYSTTFADFKQEETHLCMALLLNGYPLQFILEQFRRVSQVFQCKQPNLKNYCRVRRSVLDNTRQNLTLAKLDFEANIFFHFSFCKGMKDFSARFHRLWHECFMDTGISGIKPIVGTRNLQNLQEYLVRKKPNNEFLTIART
jgi:hypothetical protein